MTLTREDFANLSLSELVNNIWTYAEFIIRGNCKPIYNDYKDFWIEFAEKQWDKSFQNFNFVIQMLLHRKHFDFCNISSDNLDTIINWLKIIFLVV